MDAELESIGAKMDALGMWPTLVHHTWAVRPAKTVLPYFCTVLAGESALVTYRFLMLEGWQTLHDYVHTRADRWYGFYSTPMELPHFEMVVTRADGIKLFRHDPGYVPRELKETERPLVRKILWESFGLMMRVESDARLFLRYAGEQAMFARVEDAAGAWRDAPLVIAQPPPHVEKISLAKADAAAAKDLPFAREEAIELDLRILPGVMTREARPRLCYAFLGIDAATGEKIIFDRLSVNPEEGLKGLWQGLAERLLKHILARGRVPGEVKLVSGRLFRMLRPLGLHLPFKLSLHDALPRLEAALHDVATS